MKRPLFIFLLGFVLAIGGFCAFYFGATVHQRTKVHSGNPELNWLREEFHLSDADYESVHKLHNAYRTQCEEMCERIEAKNRELRTLIAQTNTITPEIARTLEEASQLRAECHKNMLAHFFAVSQKMPHEQGKRYLVWVQEKTLFNDDGMMADQHHKAAHE